MTLRLKALTKAQAYDYFVELQKLGEVKVERLEENASLIDDTWATQVFADYVRLPEPVEIDGKVVKNGPELYGQLPLPLVMKVLWELRTLAIVGPSLGKDSGSPSTSASASATPATSSSDSPAPSTASAGSPVSSTAPESPGNAPSGAPQ